jgi:hypothetical protein
LAEEDQEHDQDQGAREKAQHFFNSFGALHYNSHAPFRSREVGALPSRLISLDWLEPVLATYRLHECSSEDYEQECDRITIMIYYD